MPDTLEAEVIAIDGRPPGPPPEPNHHESGRRWHGGFQQFKGRVVSLDRRWWPLWIFLGLVFGVLIVAFLIVAALFSLLTTLARGLVRLIRGLFR